MPVRWAPLAVPLPPVAMIAPLIRSWNTPGSSAGTVTFFSSTVGLHALDDADADAVSPASAQTSELLPARNAVSKTPVLRPDSNTSGWPRSSGIGEKLFPLSPAGIVTGSLPRLT